MSNPGNKDAVPGEAAAAGGSPVSDAFLREQADEARKALAAAAEQLKAALAGTLDPRALPRKYPFITVGVVAAAGFAAALLAIPSKEQQELKRLERVRRAMYPEPEVPKEAKKAVEDAKAAAAKPPLWVTLVREGVQAARPLLVSLVTAGIKAKQSPSSDGDSTKA